MNGEETEVDRGGHIREDSSRDSPRHRNFEQPWKKYP